MTKLGDPFFYAQHFLLARHIEDEISSCIDTCAGRSVDRMFALLAERHADVVKQVAGIGDLREEHETAKTPINGVVLRDRYYSLYRNLIREAAYCVAFAASLEDLIFDRSPKNS